MRWRRHRATKDEQDREEALRHARQQLHEAEQECREAQERTSEISELSRTLRALGERNHFAPLVLRAFGGEPR